MIRVNAIKKKLEVEEQMKSLTNALKELEAVSGKDKLDKVNLVKKEKQEDRNHILLEVQEYRRYLDVYSEMQVQPKISGCLQRLFYLAVQTKLVLSLTRS